MASIPQKGKKDGKTFEERDRKYKILFKISQSATIADDGGLEIDYLKVKPGVKSIRWPDDEASDKELINLVFAKMKRVPCQKRKAQLKAHLAFVISKNKVIVFKDKIIGYIFIKARMTKN
ncbi:MAG: non-canonical purine NTP pyrophosphatase [Candidatus Aenigmatarchaeota archaeon]